MLKKQQLCIGRQPVLEALQAGQDLERIFIRRGSTGDGMQQIEKLAAALNVPVSYVPKEKLGRLTNLNHQGVIAIISSIKFYKVEDIVDRCFAAGKDPLVLILDGVTDVGNFGAICRTALGMNVDAVVIGHNHAAAVNEQAIKSSAGAIHHLHLCRHKDLAEVLNYLELSGFRSIGLDGRADKYFQEVEVAGPLALVLGSEDEGIHSSLIRKISQLAKLPMSSKLESYNVSVAAAMALYEIHRGRYTD